MKRYSKLVFQASNSLFFRSRSSQLTFPRLISTGRQFDFNSASESSLNNLLERLEEKELHLPATFDAEYTQGVLTIKFTPQTVYVLNKQPPNQQIWLSSPFSGPKRFEWNSTNETWRDVRNSEIELLEFLRSEFRDHLKITWF